MELIKINEGYTVTKTLDNDWRVLGSVTKEVSGKIIIFIEMKSEDSVIGTVTYTKPIEGNISYGQSCAEEHRAMVTTQALDLIASILEGLK